MPKPLTSADRRFGKDLRDQLRALLKLPGATKADLASKLELSDQGLEDLLTKGRVSGIRTVALAVDRCGIRLRYRGTGCVIEKRSSDMSPHHEQLVFPFVLSTTDADVSMRVGPTSDRSITLNVTLKKA